MSSKADDYVLEAVHLRKLYGAAVAVDDVSFRVERGELFGLLGPNGAGKTSTIRMAYGCSPLSGGELRVFGRDIVTDWRAIRMRIGVCHQDNNLDTEMSSLTKNAVQYETLVAVAKTRMAMLSTAIAGA